jgi:predicted DNA-binding transcriptional regulator AlpA
MPTDLLRSKEVAKLLSISPATLANWRYLGKGPKHFNWGRTVRYRAVEVQRWIEEQEKAKT